MQGLKLNIIKKGPLVFNILKREQSGQHFRFPSIFLSKKLCDVFVQISLLVKGSVNNKSTSTQVMAWHRIDRGLLQEPMVTKFIYMHMHVNDPMS